VKRKVVTPPALGKEGLLSDGAAKSVVDTSGKFLSSFSFYFPRYRPPFGECCVCSSISFPFRDTSCVWVGTCVRVCV
jgi:hypothetical protein